MNRIKFVGIIATVAIIALSMTGCPTDSGGNSNRPGGGNGNQPVANIPQALVGVWGIPNVMEVLSINANGSGTFGDEAVTWAATTTRLTLNMMGQTGSAAWEITTGGQLRLSDGQGTHGLVLAAMPNLERLGGEDDTSPHDCNLRGFHVWGNWVETVAATCIEGGERIRRCLYCANTDREMTFTLGHLWDDWVETIAATCMVHGMAIRRCLYCADIQHTVMIALGHIWGDWRVVLEPTKDTHGKSERECLREGCGYIEIYYTPALGWYCGCGLDCCYTFNDCNLWNCLNPNACACPPISQANTYGIRHYMR